MSDDEPIGAVWIRSYADEGGHYHVVIEADDDTSFPMDATAAYGWAREVLSAVAAAEYDAAVIKQLHSTALGAAAIAQVVQEIRADRAGEVPLSMVPGLSMTPGVSQRTGEGFLVLSVRGTAVGQWEMDAAREHALALLTCIEVAVLDGAYLRALEKFGLEPQTALHVVSQLGEFRSTEKSGA